MKELIIIATISFTLLFTSCKKQCSRCQNTCSKFTFVIVIFVAMRMHLLQNTRTLGTA
jgi:hypothetical protein